MKVDESNLRFHNTNNCFADNWFSQGRGTMGCPDFGNRCVDFALIAGDAGMFVVKAKRLCVAWREHCCSLHYSALAERNFKAASVRERTWSLL